MEQGEETTVENKQLIVQVYPAIEEASKDLIQIYLESRRHSGGGDIQQMDILDPKRTIMRVQFEEVDAKKRLLDKRFLSFDQFLIRVFDSDRSGGYRTDVYESNSREVILKADTADIDIASSPNDLEIMTMYAENLLPDNEVVSLRKSVVFPNTTLIQYAKDIDYPTLNSRFSKRSKIKNTSFRILESFKTNAVFIGSLVSNPNRVEYQHLKTRIITDIAKLDPEPKYFIDCDESSYLLFSLEPEFKIGDEFIDLVRAHLDESTTGVELCPNFELLDELDGSKLVSRPNSPCHKSVQTDLVWRDFEEMLDRSRKKAHSNASQSPESSLYSTNSVKNEPQVVVNSKYKHDMNTLILDSSKKYSYGLLNSKQLFVCLKDVVKKSFPDVDLTCDKDVGVIVAVNKRPNLKSEDWKNDFLHEVGKFWASRAIYEQISIPDKLKNDPERMSELNELILSFNRHNSAVYIEINNSTNTIECYGHKNVIPGKLDELMKKFPGLKKLENKQPAQQKEVKLPSNSNTNGHSNGAETKFKLEQSSLVGFCIGRCKQLLNDFGQKVKLYNGEILNGNQIRCPKSKLSKIMEHIAEFETKLCRRYYDIPAKVFTNAKQMTNLNTELEQFISGHTFTVWSELNNATRVLTLAGYTRVVNSIEEKIFSKFKVSQAQKTGSEEPSISNGASKPAAVTPSSHKFIINDLKWFQTKILLERKYFQLIESSFKNIKIFIDKDLTRILFEGDREEIEKSKNIAFKILSEILGCECESDAEFVASMNKSEEVIQEILKSQHIVCVVDAKSSKDTYTIYGTSLEDIESCKRVLSDAKLLIMGS